MARKRFGHKSGSLDMLLQSEIWASEVDLCLRELRAQLGFVDDGSEGRVDVYAGSGTLQIVKMWPDAGSTGHGIYAIELRPISRTDRSSEVD
jgi:hypothetical protein